MGLPRTLSNIVRLYAENKKRQLERSGTPNTRIDSGGNANKSTFRGQDIDRNDLRDVKQIRESGGVVSHLVHAKALMQFGTGVEFQADQDDVAEWLNDELNDIDNLLIELGEDALWYPYSLAEVVENRAGGFSHVEPIQPWTMLPIEDEHGEIVRWEQEIQGDYGGNTQRFAPDEIASFILNKNSGRDNTGVSEVLRARQEIEGYRQNANAINNAIEYAAWPRRMFKVGDPDGGIIDDNELRRVRNRVDNLDEDTTLVAGPHIEHEMLEAQNFEFDKVTEHDLRKLSLALGLPLELANVGSDGLGSGMPADLRLTLFERQARAQQRALADQFTDQVIRPILKNYSPYESDVNVSLEFGDPVEDDEQSLQEMAPYLTTNEVRERLDKAPVDDDEIGESFQEPAQAEAPDEEGGDMPGGGGGLFSERRMAEVPDNAVSITDPSEAPEGANVIKGPGGGTYYVPGGGGDSGDGEQTGNTIDELAADLPDEYSEEQSDEIMGAVEQAAQNGESYTDIVSTVEASVEGMDISAERKVRQQAYINRTQEIEINGETVEAQPVINSFVSDVKDASEDKLREDLPFGDESYDYIETIGQGWKEERNQSLLNDNTADIWAVAADQTGNSNAPSKSDIDLDRRDPDQEFKDDIIAQKEVTEEVLREMFGETVPVTRGVDGEFAEQIKQAKQNGESIELDHRTLESWSTFPDHAEKFAGDSGVLIETEVPVEDVWMSSFTTPALDKQENELVVGRSGSVEYNPENIHLPDDEGMSEVYDVAAERGT